MDQADIADREITDYLEKVIAATRGIRSDATPCMASLPHCIRSIHSCLIFHLKPIPIKMNFAHNRANLKKKGYHFSCEIENIKKGNKIIIGIATNM